MKIQGGLRGRYCMEWYWLYRIKADIEGFVLEAHKQTYDNIETCMRPRYG
jgi:hypothetical protein